MKNDINRRDLALLVPGLLAASQANAATERKKLPSMTYKFEDLTVKKNGENASRAVFDGLTHGGFQVDIHETELAPGLAPHAPHRHVHEEIVMVREGTLEVMIEGKTAVATPGSVVYVASNEFHGWKNSGTSRAHYFVMALGRAD
jgi:quercetin dioxygenase-like cupin family protein